MYLMHLILKIKTHRVLIYIKILVFLCAFWMPENIVIKNISHVIFERWLNCNVL